MRHTEITNRLRPTPSFDSRFDSCLFTAHHICLFHVTWYNSLKPPFPTLVHHGNTVSIVGFLLANNMSNWITTHSTSWAPGVSVRYVFSFPLRVNSLTRCLRIPCTTCFHCSRIREGHSWCTSTPSQPSAYFLSSTNMGNFSADVAAALFPDYLLRWWSGNEPELWCSQIGS